MLEDKVIESLHKSLNDIGYEIVRVKLLKEAQDKTLQIMIDCLNEDREIDIKDCEKVSHIASAILDIDNIMESKYNLEVSSPGIDRPLVKIKDYINYKGFEAKFTVDSFVNGSKRFKAKILGIDGENIKLLMINNSEEAIISIDQIISAQLVLTDELIKFSKDRYLKNRKTNE
ncbi:MAG: ribosome maturation factor RimP [Alphaproteobacteria bacterium]